MTIERIGGPVASSSESSNTGDNDYYAAEATVNRVGGNDDWRHNAPQSKYSKLKVKSKTGNNAANSGSLTNNPAAAQPWTSGDLMAGSSNTKAAAATLEVPLNTTQGF